MINENLKSELANDIKPVLADVLKVGQRVWIKEYNNRHGQREELRECTIVHLGRKYFETENKWMGRFNIESLEHDGGKYSPRYKVYLNPQKFEDEVEANILSSKIRTRIGNYGDIKLPLHKMRQILEILHSENDR